ncbi:MAG: hypothetical protein VB070_06075 [Clostridiaceae bacterium]|nr:hypothetical protein [Clostridiaceae bacterium]
MIVKPKAGLLPLYAGLYDKQDPLEKNTYEPFIQAIAKKFTALGIDVLDPLICVYKCDIEAAIHRFENQNACAVVILFLAYHPSMVSAKTLTQTDLPVIMLDTTECYDFDSHTDPMMISRCHGIHGVQDLCCVLKRMGKEYRIETGHYQNSQVIDRVANIIKSCYMADNFRKSRVGIIGQPFQDMGDFTIPFSKLENITGIQTIPFEKEKILTWNCLVGAGEIDEKKQEIINSYKINGDLDSQLIEAASVSTLILEKWIMDEKLDAFTFNFLDFNQDLGLPTIPFVAACQLMAKGIAYAGEGDVLTAALIAAVMSIYPDSSFIEMFCPDWKNGTVFLSHMGEANRAVLRQPTLIKKQIPFVPGVNGGMIPAVAGFYQGGQAILVNIAPEANDKFHLILAPCEIIEPTDSDNYGLFIRGWLQPDISLEQFLKKYSQLGGTHHSCLCYGAELAVLIEFGKMIGCNVSVIDHQIGE